MQLIATCLHLTDIFKNVKRVHANLFHQIGIDIDGLGLDAQNASDGKTATTFHLQRVFIVCILCSTRLWFGQAYTIYLSVVSQREVVRETPIGGSHIGWQPVGKPCTKIGSRQLVVDCFDVSHQLFGIAYLTNLC